MIRWVLEFFLTQVLDFALLYRVAYHPVGLLLIAVGNDEIKRQVLGFFTEKIYESLRDANPRRIIMFDKTRLQKALVQYKQDFIPKQWKNEKYKWEVVKHFQDNWDVNAADFTDMLHRALSKTNNLLTSQNNYPAKMIEKLSIATAEEVRAMYIALFDESKDVVERIITFKDKSTILLKWYGNGAGQHYQHENAVSTYLWLRYPDKYVYQMSGNKISVRTLDLNCEFSDITEQLKAIVDEHFAIPVS